MPKLKSEFSLERPFLGWLRRNRRIRNSSIVRRELRWFGRRVDLVTITGSGLLTAYELKLRDNRGAIRQAAYNRLAFDRSYVVTACKPTDRNIRHAKEAGVGFIVFSGNDFIVLEPSEYRPVRGPVRQLLVRTIKSKA